MKPDTPVEYIQHHLQAAQAITDGLYPYLTKNTSPPTDTACKLERTTRETDWNQLHLDGKTNHKLSIEMMAGHYEAQLLTFLAKLIHAREVLEIGMFTGLTTLTLAEYLKTINGKVTTCEGEPYLKDFTKLFFKEADVDKYVEVLTGEALVTLEILSSNKKSFDLIFIDADKTGYISYFEHIMSNDLLRPNGLICVDNTLYKGRVYTNPNTENELAITLFNQAILKDERVEQIILPVRDGISLIRRKESHCV